MTRFDASAGIQPSVIVVTTVIGSKICNRVSNDSSSEAGAQQEQREPHSPSHPPLTFKERSFQTGLPSGTTNGIRSRLRVTLRQPPEARTGWGLKSISGTASKASKAARAALLSLNKMPAWFRHESNQRILHGYRPISGSAQASFCS